MTVMIAARALEKSPGVDEALALLALDGAAEIGRVEVHKVSDPERQVLHAHVEERTYAFLTNLVVATHRRRQGVGTRLMLAAEDQARGWHLPSIVLSATPDTPAWRLYRNLGYSEIVPHKLSPKSTSRLLKKTLH